MKPALLMIAGWAYGPECLQPLARDLSAEWNVEVAAAEQLLNEKRLPPADAVVGWSLGGMLALQRLPAGCRKLVLLAATARFCAADGYPCGVPERVLQRMQLRLRRAPEEVLAEFHRNVCAPRPPAPPDPRISAGLAEGLEHLRTADLRALVPAIGIPVCLIHGDADRIVPPAASDWLAQRLPNAIRIRRPGEGHRLDFLALAPVLRRFWDGSEP